MNDTITGCLAHYKFGVTLTQVLCAALRCALTASDIQRFVALCCAA